jgi:hypothetical protein
MGVNFGKEQAGRKTMAGDDISPRFDVDDYKRRYEGRYREVIEELVNALEGITIDEGNGMSDDCRSAIRSFLQRLQQANRTVKSAIDPPKQTNEEGPPGAPRPKTHYRGSPVSPVTRKTADARSAKRKRRWFSGVGYKVDRGGFSPQERSLLNPENFHE